jgi:hypothetical protein
LAKERGRPCVFNRAAPWEPISEETMILKTIVTATWVLMAAIFTMWLPAACATGPHKVPEPQSMTEEAGLAPDSNIKAILDKGGETIDYHNLMRIHKALVQSPHPVARMDQLLRQLIYKRNEDPRVDQMILIFVAKTIGNSPYPIPNAQDLLETILEQGDRINEWVISFVAEATQAYIYDLPQGDKLVDQMEVKLAQIRSADRSQAEYFGFHFLPPPTSAFIREYLSGIGERLIRQHERNLYYEMINEGLTEKQIETGLRFLQSHGEPGSGEKCPHLMRCLMRNRNHLPFQ